jgi:hypothetical protein
MCRNVLNSRAQPILRLSSRICRFVGAAALGSCAVFLAEGRLYQDSHGKLFQSSREALSTPAPLVCHARASPSDARKFPISGFRLSSSRGMVRAHFVSESGTFPTLLGSERRETWVLPGTATLSFGRCAISVGDPILVITDAGSYTYRVESLRVVSPSDISVLSTTSRPILTLVTCYPFHYIGDAPSRFVVCRLYRSLLHVSSQSRARVKSWVGCE